MRALRRHYAPGSYFFTVVTEHRRPLLIDNIGLLRSAFRTTALRRPFTIDAIVVLPDHLHTIWTLPASDPDFSARWRILKRIFSCGLPTPVRTASQLHRRELGVWQRRFWDHLIRDERDLRRHMDYLHYNPVKHGLCATAAEWPYSSFSRMIARGWYPADWGGAAEVAPPGLFPE